MNIPTQGLLQVCRPMAKTVLTCSFSCSLDVKKDREKKLSGNGRVNENIVFKPEKIKKTTLGRVLQSSNNDRWVGTGPHSFHLAIRLIYLFLFSRCEFFTSKAIKHHRRVFSICIGT